ncbi:MAG: prenyltransferase/squalene oxidase repeat-containing protein, partial [bacterium]
MEPLLKIYEAEAKLRLYCEQVDFKGWDPWDALQAPIFRLFPLNQRIFRWAGNHLVKIAPFNPRTLMGIRRDCFAKGLALFLAGYLQREKLQHEKENVAKIDLLLERLLKRSISGYSGICWGTNVPYQTRAFYVPPQMPSLVHTAVAVEALLDLADFKRDDELIELAESAGRFVLNDLNIRQEPSGIAFSYTPNDHSRVINVTALAARMLARTGVAVGNPEFIQHAEQAARYVINAQAEDGSWQYGQNAVHHWIDNYHTGFVLEALEDYRSITGDDEVAFAIRKGGDFYRRELFLEDGTPKFSPNSIYPIDGHCLAQGILTFAKLKDYNATYLSFAHT